MDFHFLIGLFIGLIIGVIGVIGVIAMAMIVAARGNNHINRALKDEGDRPFWG